MSIKEYEDLANAVVLTAMDDVISWQLAVQNGKDVSKQMERDGKKALSFLSDEQRLGIFTNFSPKDIAGFMKRRIEQIESGSARRHKRTQNYIEGSL